MRITTLILTLLCLLPAGRVMGNNVDLSTVPRRDTVQLTIYNSEDITLVRETRKITFKKGVNPLQFSWANTLIDPTSVQLRFLSAPEKLEILDTTFPHDKPQMLYWNVQSEFDGEGTVEISYFTSGITWAADYMCVADKEEKTVNLESFVRVTNQSGEDYEGAQVRLVVGTINLVEKIAQLSRMPAKDLEILSKSELRDEFSKSGAARAIFSDGATVATSATPEEKKIIKEGLSEYFIYTVEGTETIPNGWSKRMRSLEAKAVPVKIQYRYRPQEYGDQLVRMYLMTNDIISKLGTTPMPNGTIRVFRDNGRDGLSYLTAQPLKYIPIGDKIEVNLGNDPEVIFDLVKKRVYRDQVWTLLDGVDVLRRIEDGVVQIDVNSHVVGWDEHAIFDQRIRNYTPRPIDVEIRRSFDGDAVFTSNLTPVQFDYRTVQFQASVEPGQKADLIYELTTHQGHNARQNHVEIVNREVKP